MKVKICRVVATNEQQIQAAIDGTPGQYIQVAARKGTCHTMSDSKQRQCVRLQAITPVLARCILSLLATRLSA